MNKLICCMLLIALSFGCAKPPFEVFRPEAIVLPKTTPYDIQADLAKISKPTRPKYSFGKFTDQGETKLTYTTESNEADVYILVPEEYGKVKQLSILAGSYKSIIIDQEDLINIEREKVNSYQNLVTLVEKERDIATSAWVNSENAFREEERDHKWDNRVNKAGMILLYLGSIISVALTL